MKRNSNGINYETMVVETKVDSNDAPTNRQICIATQKRNRNRGRERGTLNTQKFAASKKECKQNEMKKKTTEWNGKQTKDDGRDNVHRKCQMN